MNAFPVGYRTKNFSQKRKRGPSFFNQLSLPNTKPPRESLTSRRCSEPSEDTNPRRKPTRHPTQWAESSSLLHAVKTCHTTPRYLPHEQVQGCVQQWQSGVWQGNHAHCWGGWNLTNDDLAGRPAALPMLAATARPEFLTWCDAHRTAKAALFTGHFNMSELTGAISTLSNSW